MKQTAAPAHPHVTPARGPLVLQRCACGGTPGPTGECAECRKKRLGLQRKESGPGPAVAPPIVHEVLRAPGRPLEPETRSFMESRFGHDFGKVRVHVDAQAAESARSVGAMAYTVGSHVAFGAGLYAPGSPAGRRLLAHELAHTVQQGQATPVLQGELSSGGSDDVWEREAEAFADGSPVALTPAGPVLQRSDGEPIEVDLVPVDPVEAEDLRRRGVDLPDVSAETYSAIGGDLLKAGQPLTEEDRENAAREAQTTPPAGSLIAFTEGPRFMLHDTAAGTKGVSNTRIAELQKLGRRSSGEGAAAYVPRDDPSVMAHPSFFSTRRPAASQYERAQDILTKPERESRYRRVWRATGKIQREAALDAVLAAQGSSAAEAKQLRAEAIAQLNAGSGDVKSAAAWAVEDICNVIAFLGAGILADSPATEAELEKACQELDPVHQARKARISSITNVEIVQPRASDCWTTDAQVRAFNKKADPKDRIPGDALVPLPTPPYTANQYEGIKRLYLGAALEAGQFPQITTHFWLDKTPSQTTQKPIGSHCDPRCFDLGHLYDLIRTALGHPAGAIYGLSPSYGTGSADNVWWVNRVCGGAPP